MVSPVPDPPAHREVRRTAGPPPPDVPVPGGGARKTGAPGGGDAPTGGVPPELSVLVPVYNEERTLTEAVERLASALAGIPFEVVAVDDGSVDGTGRLLDTMADGRPWMRVLHHPKNRGKGAAVRTALAAARGRLVCIYDADLEYDPRDIPRLLEPLREGWADAVYGVRNFGGTAAHSFWYVVGNRAVSTFANVLYNCYLRDIMTCFKVMGTPLMRSLDISRDGFDLEAEITAKLLRRGHRIYEVPISYRARSHAEGKKLRAVDALGVLAVLVSERFSRPGPTA